MSELSLGLVLTDIATIPLRLDEFSWEVLSPGVELSPLCQDAAGNTKLGLLRYAPGAKVPEHLHTGMEYIHVLAGAQQDERGTYRTGTLLVSFPGSRHSIIASAEGCVVLAVWETPVRFL